MANNSNSNNNEIQLVAFKLAKEEYTIPIESVQEIIMPQTSTHIPKTPEFIEGVINLRGHIIPVIDGRKRFNLTITKNNPSERIIVIEIENHKIGLIVDSISEVVHLKKVDIEPSPINIKGNEFITGVGKIDDRLLILLD